MLVVNETHTHVLTLVLVEGLDKGGLEVLMVVTRGADETETG